MKIDTAAFMESLPIMGVGLLGIFIVTAVIIIGIYILRALTSQKAESEAETKTENEAGNATALDLMKEREKKDFLDTDNEYTISKDL